MVVSPSGIISLSPLLWISKNISLGFCWFLISSSIPARTWPSAPSTSILTTSGKLPQVSEKTEHVSTCTSTVPVEPLDAAIEWRPSPACPRTYSSTTPFSLPSAIWCGKIRLVKLLRAIFLLSWLKFFGSGSKLWMIELFPVGYPARRKLITPMFAPIS